MQLINDLSSTLSSEKEALVKAFEKVIDSGWVVLGPEVDRFESAFSSYLDIPHCVGVANGTDALELGLKSIGITANDRVATVSNAGGYTSNALAAIGAIPYFLDIDENTYCTTLDEISKAINDGVKAVVVTHLFGLATPDIREIANLCQRNDVMLLEDCAQAHGAMIDGQYVGTFGDVASFSFYPTKNLGAIGDAGAVVTSNKAIATVAKQLRQYGWKSKYSIEQDGGRNSRLDEIQAAFLNVLLPSLDSRNQQRRAIADRYNKEISHEGIIKPNHSGKSYVAHLYVVLVEQRAALQEHLREKKISSDIHYPIADHQQVVFSKHGNDIQLPNTEKIIDLLLTLPCYPGMTEQQVNHVIKSVNSWK